jgi:Flp pilus assembly protein TadB
MSAPFIAAATTAVGLAGRQRLVGTRGTSTKHPSAAHAMRAECDWAALLDAIAAGVRAGHSLPESFTSACHRTPPRGSALSVSTELHQLPSLVAADPDEAVALQTLSVALLLGGPTAVVLQSGATLLRERASVRAEAAAHAAQARLSARVLTAVPLLFATWGAVASPSFRQALLGPLGAGAAMAGVVLNAVGWWWMRRIVRRVVT